MTRTTTPIASTKTPKPVTNDSDKLLAAMIANMSRCQEPALVEKLATAIRAIQTARRQNP
jgi:hypothetical protein